MGDFTKGYAIGALVMTAAFLVPEAIRGFPRRIPTTEKVQAGYVVPSKLEIECKDLDGNGEVETIIKVDGKSYLLKYNSQKMPLIQPYEIKPAEVIPKQE